jgi:flagellar motor protein MotB
MSTLATPPPKPRTDADKGSSQTLFLSLFLLILAFFILLNSMSTFEEGRSTEVMESVQLAFPSSVQAQVQEKFLSEDPGQVIGQALQAGLGAVFQETLPLVEITVDPTGNPLYITVPAAGVFARTTGSVTPAAEDLARRLGPMLERPPVGSVLFLDVVFGRNADFGADDRTTLNDGVVFAASTTIERFSELGLPKDRISIGVEQGDPDTVRFIFRTRPSTSVSGGG